MDLLEIHNGYVYPSVHALMIEPFNRMWENDTSENHEECLKDFSYIELMCSPKKSNPYFGYIDTDIREKKVKEKIYGNPEYPSSTEMILGCMEYNEQLKHESPSFELLEDAMKAAEKQRKWCADFDPDSRTGTGALLLKPKELMNALNEIPNTVKRLEESRDRVVSELKEMNKTRGDREINPFER